MSPAASIHPRRLLLLRTGLVALVFAAASLPALAAHVRVQLDGLDDELSAAALGALELQQYSKREVSRAQVQRLYRRAERQIQRALEPYGYYNVGVAGELANEGEDYRAVFTVKPGDPVKITAVDIHIDGETEGLRAVDKARAAFSPRQGQRLDHAEYERSKAAIHAALFSVGYLDAELATHRVEVQRAANTATIKPAWKVGQRYRFADTGFEGSQFPDEFMQRYKLAAGFAVDKLNAAPSIIPAGASMDAGANADQELEASSA